MNVGVSRREMHVNQRLQGGLIPAYKSLRFKGGLLRRFAPCKDMFPIVAGTLQRMPAMTPAMTTSSLGINFG